MFSPPALLRNPYVQTLLPFVMRRGASLRLVRERWETPDGDFLDVDLCGGVVGFSLGGSVLLHWLAEERGGVPPEVLGGVAVSVPFDVRAAILSNDRPHRWLFREFFLRTLRPKALARRPLFPGLLDPEAIRAARTMRAFDEAVTAPLHGFESAEDYWRRASVAPRLGAIARPCLLLAAADDPIIPSESIPRDAIRRNPHLSLEETARGGHVGFVAGTPLAPRFYAEERAVSFLDGLIGP